MVTGHPGWWKMLELVSHNYWWLGISHYVASYIAGCDACNCCKSFLTQKVGKLMPNQIPSCHWEVISVDTIGELPESKGYNAILIVVDRLSKCIHAVTLGSPGYGQGPLGLADIRSATGSTRSPTKGMGVMKLIF